MLSLEELEQFIAFAEDGTLSKAAERLHMSQPTITRTMKKAEDEFGVSLFIRSKNKLEFNETGEVAVTYARHVVEDYKRMIDSVRKFDKSLQTVVIQSCMPTPIPYLIALIFEKYPLATISSSIEKIENIVSSVKSGDCEYGIVPFPVEEEGVKCRELFREHLSVCLPKNHPIAENGSDSLRFSDINGLHFMINAHAGFMEDLCRRQLPDAEFLKMDNVSDMVATAHDLRLPFFITKSGKKKYSAQLKESHVIIPLEDEAAEIVFYAVFREDQIFKIL
ncbi:MAG: LysR family transcriptional regulator [Oscillospiraceae bacterium]|nr:LysR family transcriptional regulator [Oscillospiraceae bacterium]